MCKRALMWILWPSFLASAATSILLFAMIDPNQLAMFDRHVPASSVGVYSLWFFMLWACASVSSTISLYLVPGLIRSLKADDGLNDS